MIKPVPGQEGYFVDSDGNFYSKWINKGIHGLVLGDELKLLKGMKNKSGHISVRFGREGKRIYLHRLVYEVFNGPVPIGLVVRHKNDIPTDNRISNLIVGTQKDNVKDCIENGNFKAPLAKLNMEIAKEIRELKRIKKIPNSEIAITYGVSRRTIDLIIKNQIWKEVV